MIARVLATWRDDGSGMRVDKMADGRYVIENGAGYELSLTFGEWIGLQILADKWQEDQ